jgi:hypothetical protein
MIVTLGGGVASAVRQQPPILAQPQLDLHDTRAEPILNSSKAWTEEKESHVD